MTRPVEERFWEKVEIGSKEECWPWLGCRSQGKYGQFQIGGRALYTHRLVWEFTFGPIPEGKVIRHACNNPICTNPDHLRIGTQGDNILDKVKQQGGGNPFTGPLIQRVRQKEPVVEVSMWIDTLKEWPLPLKPDRRVEQRRVGNLDRRKINRSGVRMNLNGRRDGYKDRRKNG